MDDQLSFYFLLKIGRANKTLYKLRNGMEGKKLSGVVLTV